MTKYDFGIHPLEWEGPSSNAPSRHGYEKSFAILNPIETFKLQKEKKVGNEWVLGEEVMEMINKENDKGGEAEKWNNRLGITRYDNRDGTMIATYPSCEVKEDMDGYFELHFDNVIPLNGTEGVVLQETVGKLKHGHPILQIASQKKGLGGFAAREDYSCTLFWNSVNGSGGIDIGGHLKTEKLTRQICIDECERQTALLLDDGELLILDEKATIKSKFAMVEEGEKGCLKMIVNGMLQDSIMGVSNESLVFFDLRKQSSDAFKIPVNNSPTEMTSIDEQGRFFLASNQALSLYDLRMVSTPVLEYDWDYIGCKNVASIQWTGKEDNTLLVHDKGRPHGTIVRLSGVNSGALCFDRIKLNKPCIGLDTFQGSTWILTEDDNKLYCIDNEEDWSAIEKIGALFEENKLVFAQPVPIGNKDKFFKSIFNVNGKLSTDDTFDPQTIPPAGELPDALPSICKQLQKHWMIE